MYSWSMGHGCQSTIDNTGPCPLPPSVVNIRPVDNTYSAKNTYREINQQKLNANRNKQEAQQMQR